MAERLAAEIKSQEQLPSINVFRMVAMISGRRVKLGQDAHVAIADVLAQYATLVEAALDDMANGVTLPKLDEWFAARYVPAAKPAKAETPAE